MSLVARKFTLVSAADYLADENDGLSRHEFVNGAVYAMSGASDRHNLVRGRLAALLLTRLSEPRQVFGADMKLRIRTNADERYYYPDVFVTCDPNDRERYTRDHAVFVVEVLSPSTERIDRTESLKLTSVSQHCWNTVCCLKMRLSLSCSDAGPIGVGNFHQKDNTVTFESVGLTINVSELYRAVTFEEPASPNNSRAG